MRINFLSFFFFWLTTLHAVAVFSAEKTALIQLSSGLFYSQGQSQTLGSPDSIVWSTPLLISSSIDQFHASLNTALLSVTNHYQNFNNQTNGLGDTQISIGYDLMQAPWITLSIKEKFATGDVNKGLSTGINDTAIQLDYFQTLSVKNSLFATLGHQWIGKVSGYKMQDSVYASIGFAKQIHQNSIGLTLDYSQTIFLNLKDTFSSTFFASHALAKGLTLNIFAGYDSTQSSNLGTTLTVQF